MAATEVDASKEHNQAVPGALSGPVDTLADSLANANIQDDKSHEKANHPPREPHVYTRAQLLWISKSPLVKPPEGMPALKDWFGDWSEQQVANKKEGESSSNGTGTRDRRFRRDPEEGDAPTRPSFRSSLSQPSQMGNFRHQSLRTADRERERDPERDRQRDERDREGQERLRNLSDKYDRERLALSSATGVLRGKERESAPHLASTTRNGQTQTAATRRAEGREAAKKKPGEVSDDWRRGAEPPSRAGRDDRSDTTRRDRDRRDTSRTRREPSSTRRDRDNKERDRSRRRDERDDRRDRDDYFRRDWDDRDDGYRDRDRYEYSRRDGDRDRELDEDPRRWRDDGKRDERQATRRERERGERDRERGWDRWEPSHDRDRLDERDGRSKRGGRDRRSGAGLDDAKDKEEKKDREKEKEPAWMETYIPTTPGGGILGGQLADGELDGIQAWKKGLKEKERKEKEAELAADTNSKPATAGVAASSSESGAAAATEGSLDEIQIFKMLMKKEAAKKDTDQGQDSPVSPPGATPAAIGRTAPLKLKDPAVAAVSTPAESPVILSESSSMAIASSSTSPSAQNDGAKLLSLFTQMPGDGSTAQSSKFPSPAIPAPDAFPPAVSRMFPTPPGLSPSVSQNSERPTIDLSTPSYPNTPFDPPAASRLLAFGARAGPGVAQLTPKNLQADPSAAFGGSQQTILAPPGQKLLGNNALGGLPNNAVQQGPELMFMESESHPVPNPRATPSERSARSFSPFTQAHQQQVFATHDSQDTMRLPQAEAMRRMAPERGMAMGPDGGFMELGGHPANFNPAGFELGNAGPTSSAVKGSRLAKFFDQKRDAQAHAQAQALRKGPGGNGYMSTSPHPGQGRDALAMNGMPGNLGESRAMEDIFAMLQQSSSQNHRASPQLQQSGRGSAAGAPFGQAPIDLQVLQQQQLQQLHQQQLMQQNRLDALYDSRMDDRNFVPDGMVPGLRPAPRPRSREPAGLHFTDHLDEPLQVNPRLAQSQRAALDLYNGPAPSAYGRNVGGIQQNQFRGGPGMLPGQGLPQGPPQRVHPNLANLGGRPPHDASQFLNNQLNNLPPHGGMHMQQQQQSLNNFSGAGFNGPIQRGPINPPHHNNPGALNQLAGLGSGNGVDLRMHNQAQLLNLNNAGGLGVNNGIGGGPRGGNIGFNGHHSSATQLQAQQLALRQQQQHQHQQQLQQLGMPQTHLLPPHLQQQQQQQQPGTQELMALLMGGQRGE